MEHVILVDMLDSPLGLMEKMKAHEKGLLHRAFSVFLFQDRKILLQKRAAQKYHCGGLWTNTCCSHPREGENIISAAKRRLYEELGIKIDMLQEAGEFVYRYPFSNGLIEFEYDHVLTGFYNGNYILNPDEAESAKWVDVYSLMQDIRENPELYTPWLVTALGIAIKGASLL